MTVNEELQEHTEHARNPFDKQVAASMAIIAAVLAVVSVFGHLTTTEELLWQQRASDQWSYYQAKSIRRYESEIASDLFRSMKDPASTVYASKSDGYRSDGEKIQEQAKKFEEESHLASARALRLHFGEVLLEVAIVFASLAILSKRRGIWVLSVMGGAAGAIIAGTAALIR
ncbi:MAG TPA: DUF4337 domain-containing protein [Bryobacteraceae bacterium]|nr:DUF4337 domain-containing protein [Bryobacteraceae bacterium]